MSERSLSTSEPPGVSEGVRDRAKRNRLIRIRKAAADLLVVKSFHQITTKEVAQLAGVGEATLFRYISGKHDLLTMAYADQMDALLNRIEEDDARQVASTRGGPLTGQHQVDRIYQVYNTRCDFYLVNPTNAALYLREGFEAGGETAARHIAQGDRTIRLVASILQDGQRARVLTDVVDPFIVAQNCHGTYIHEIDRTPARGFDPATIWDRLVARLAAQLVPLIERSS
ncbi:hypothetical protein RW1_009_01090 [Rhodococcus wratislaviensis NBRC 100605]|uniref:HTH tetR-type domain-containing protein n=1 Tax=Rhodococcus wratislaviensis NBRC 100605 TaxID=1219028 RepID=X0QYJ0_RHOWR|nr:hypothetical protein RW1_009_01090 [Rhodococcus wratislaviensis NBRC 100605]